MSTSTKGATKEGRVLLLTIGTGDMTRPEETLFAPLRKSMATEAWTRIVLLPSTVTAANAETLQAAGGDLPIRIDPLPEPGQENDADACFGHFDRVIAALLAAGHRAEAMVADYTRGTKAMSAALVLAAVGRGVPVLRYISGQRRDERGMVVPGTERVTEAATALATGRRLLALARAMIKRGSFAAAEAVLPADPHPAHAAETAAARSLAAFYAAWDRLNYRQACEHLAAITTEHPAWVRFTPPPAVQDWISALAAPLDRDRTDKPAMAGRMRLLICDLMANTERRLAQGQFEDAVVRLYRILELLGQARLFDHGYDSAALPTDDPAVAAFQAHLQKKGDAALTLERGAYQAGRDKVARFLHRLGDPLAKELQKMAASHITLRARVRNDSLLIHGFEAKAPSAASQIQAALQDLEALVLADDPDAVTRLALARFPTRW